MNLHFFAFCRLTCRTAKCGKAQVGKPPRGAAGAPTRALQPWQNTQLPAHREYSSRKRSQIRDEPCKLPISSRKSPQILDELIIFAVSSRKTVLILDETGNSTAQGQHHTRKKISQTVQAVAFPFCFRAGSEFFRDGPSATQ